MESEYQDIEITLRHRDGWFDVVRIGVEHRIWFGFVLGDDSFSHQGVSCRRAGISTRIDPFSCVEGPAEHWRAIIDAIRSRDDEDFKRVGLKFVRRWGRDGQEAEGGLLYSPRNNGDDPITGLSLKTLDVFADRAELVLKESEQ